MSDIYAILEADLGNSSDLERAGGSIEDAIAGNIEIDMLATLSIAWIWTIPWTVLAYAMIYFKLFGAQAHTLADQE